MVNKQKKRKINKDTNEDTQSSKNILNVGETSAEIHVEYELLPNFNFKFDCRCWETAAKIYTENNEWCLKSIPCTIKEKTCWIIFSVHHLVYLNEPQLRKFFNYVIVFHIFCGRQKLSERAKQDKVKGFYIDDDFLDTKGEEFLEIHPLNSTSKSSIPSFPEPMIISHEDYGDFNITTYLEAIPDRIHEYYFRKMLRKKCFPPVTLNFEELVSSTPRGTSISSKRTKKYANNKTKKPDKKSKRSSGTESFEIHLPAEVLFSDTGTVTKYHHMADRNISSILIYAQCANILSDKQVRMNLNPISIKLEQLSNLPIDIIRENGFKCLYAKILFAHRTFVTPHYIPDKTMCFEFIKCLLCEEFQSEEIINFLNTQFLTVEIIGIRKVNEAISNEVLLGVTEFDVSDLLRGFWDVRLTNALMHPRNIFPAQIDANVETGEISWKNSPLTADVLTSYSTLAPSVLRHVLTGFVIQDCERFYIFLEGLSNGYLLKIWEKLAKLPIQQKCIYYNSNYVFVTRFYEDFISLGGIVYIKLSECLELQLRNHNFYIGETKTTLQATTIRKLGLINLALTMKSLCQTRLFPEPKDVKAFIDNIRKIDESTNGK
ncbi:uncharacterized protein LOC113464475 [Ceratina calcarata]|uniref:Uncharacterized protein LOC113464475 n=1 Tax=Ceratina calcarata TaxID=156304 RepID=A0AAJ7S2J8_9HYME|nr:uncharacterized protein LOC113464475 [Ceratina calcarata]